jgi:hypothetical protein
MKAKATHRTRRLAQRHGTRPRRAYRGQRQAPWYGNNRCRCARCGGLGQGPTPMPDSISKFERRQRRSILRRFWKQTKKKG